MSGQTNEMLNIFCVYWAYQCWEQQKLKIPEKARAKGTLGLVGPRQCPGRRRGGGGGGGRCAGQKSHPAKVECQGF